MAERYPTIEDFDAGQTQPRDNVPIDVDPTASTKPDLRAREKAELGDDADFFAAADAHEQDHGHAAASGGRTADAVDGEHDLLGDYNDGPDGSSGLDLDGAALSSTFQGAFPALDTHNSNIGPGGTITGNNEPFLTTAHPVSSAGASAGHETGLQVESEPDVIKQWKERRAQAIHHRDKLSASRKAETEKAARAAIDDFYGTYNGKKEKTIAQTRREADDFLAHREDTTAGGTSWERIAKLVDLTGKGAKGGAAGGGGKDRFRELLLSLKKDQKAPGATGY
ncbi:MAG: hypothetical protein M1826_003245 [Phylliscum demangeonii]|nr:MAG: hypothetical protein M1826_003245 [Phylliscum demangeonii]